MQLAGAQETLDATLLSENIILDKQLLIFHLHTSSVLTNKRIVLNIITSSCWLLNNIQMNCFLSSYSYKVRVDKLWFMSGLSPKFACLITKNGFHVF